MINIINHLCSNKLLNILHLCFYVYTFIEKKQRQQQPYLSVHYIFLKLEVSDRIILTGMLVTVCTLNQSINVRIS